MVELNLDHFLEYFIDIPERHWSKTTDAAEFSVYDWCNNDECRALFMLTNRWGFIEDVNDGMPGYELFGDTIKSRVMNFLLYIKGMTEDES